MVVLVLRSGRGGHTEPGKNICNRGGELLPLSYRFANFHFICEKGLLIWAAELPPGPFPCPGGFIMNYAYLRLKNGPIFAFWAVFE